MKLLLPTTPKNLTPLLDVARYLLSDARIVEAHIENQSLANQAHKQLSISDSAIIKSDLSQMTLESFDTFNSVFKACDFTASTFSNSSWHVIECNNIRCSGTQITNSTLKNTSFKNVKLELVNFRFSRFDCVLFEDCVLDDVDFYNATLKNVEFINCAINNITFSGAKMKNVDISRSTIDTIKGIGSLKGVTISYDQLLQLAPYFAAEAGIKVK